MMKIGKKKLTNIYKYGLTTSTPYTNTITETVWSQWSTVANSLFSLSRSVTALLQFQPCPCKGPWQVCTYLDSNSTPCLPQLKSDFHASTRARPVVCTITLYSGSSSQFSSPSPGVLATPPSDTLATPPSETLAIPTPDLLATPISHGALQSSCRVELTTRDTLSVLSARTPTNASTPCSVVEGHTPASFLSEWLFPGSSQETVPAFLSIFSIEVSVVGAFFVCWVEGEELEDTTHAQ